MIDIQNIFTVIMAGGNALRLDGMQKALIKLAGKPIIEHILQRCYSLPISKENLAINANQSIEKLEQYGLPVFPDCIPDMQGPLLGVYSAMKWLHEQKKASSHLLVLPCDTPFFPQDLLEKFCLMDAEKILVASYQGVMQPTFSVWPTHLLADLKEAIFDLELRGFKEFLASYPYEIHDWPRAKSDPFININTKEDLARAELLF